MQTVASCLYDHQFYLTKEEAIEKDPLLKEYRGTIQRKPPKMARTSRLSLPEATKLLPHSTDDWKPYEYVLPSARTQTDFKQNLAIQHDGHTDGHTDAKQQFAHKFGTLHWTHCI